MNEEHFWKLISLFDWDKSGDDMAVMKPAMDALSKMSVEEIKKFDDILSEKLYAIDTREHARGTGEYSEDEDSYFSVDYFLYQRCCVVSNGQQFYESVLADPMKMPQGLDFESLLYLARAAYMQKTGQEYDYFSKVSYETCSNKAGWN